MHDALTTILLSAFFQQYFFICASNNVTYLQSLFLAAAQLKLLIEVATAWQDKHGIAN